MSTALWTGAGYQFPMRWTFKKDMPPHIRREAFRVDFELFGVGYIAKDQNNEVLMPDGRRMKTIEFYLNTPHLVIGPRDLSCADNRKWSQEWRNAFIDRALEHPALAR